ncbi:MAG TPA: hypothetical protein VGB82_07340 [Alphaproteobacteria bacterium]
MSSDFFSNFQATGQIWTRTRPLVLPFLYKPLSPRVVGNGFYAALGQGLVRDKKDAWILVNPYSLGDTYLLGALGEAFRRVHCADGKELVLVVKSSAFPAALMFKRHFDRIIGLEDLYLNAVHIELSSLRLPSRLVLNEACFPHPNHVTDARADFFTALEHVSQASMYMLLLGLPLDSSLALPEVAPEARAAAATLAGEIRLRPGRSVLLFPDANSWPAVADEFWATVVPKLQAAGWDVYTNGSGSWRGARTEPIAGTRLIQVPLDVVLPFLEHAGWAAGTLCGLMNMIASSRTRCRKTIVTLGIGPGSAHQFQHPLAVRRTYPYAYQRKFDGMNYDIEELQVLGAQDHDPVAARIAGGFNALSAAPPSAEPVVRLPVDLAPGELFDKISILEIKRDRLPSEKRVQVEKELAVLNEIARPLLETRPGLDAKYADLKQLNVQGWDLNEHIFKQFDDTDYGDEGWRLDPKDAGQLQAVERSVREFRRSQQTNRDRVRLKNEINAICRAAWDEMKSFDVGPLRL